MLIILYCSKCDKQFKRILPNLESAVDLLCKICNTKLVRAIHDLASCHVKDILDNGLMAKRVERFTDAEQLYQDHGKIDEN